MGCVSSLFLSIRRCTTRCVRDHGGAKLRLQPFDVGDYMGCTPGVNPQDETVELGHFEVHPYCETAEPSRPKEDGPEGAVIHPTDSANRL